MAFPDVMGSGRRRAAAVLSFFAFVACAAGGLGTPAAAAAGGVTVDARIDGRPLHEGTEARPIRLWPRRSATLSVEVTNNSNRPLDIRIVRLEGKVVGLTFFAYDTSVGLRVAPGAKGSRRFPLDLGGLDGQATGLIPGAVKVLDVDRHTLAEEAGVVDVRGSLWSVYGLFGMGVAVLTVVSFLGALVGLARHRLPPNRWRRALRFMTPGIGVGLLVNFTLSATRVWVPGVSRWLTIVVVSAAVFFGLGYLTPRPIDEEEEDEEERLALPARPVVPALDAPEPHPELDAPEPHPELEGPEPQAVAELEGPELQAMAELEAPEPQPELEAAEALPAPPPAPETVVVGAIAEEPAVVEAEGAAPEGAEAVPAPQTVVVEAGAVATVPPVADAAGPDQRLPIVIPCHLPAEPSDAATTSSPTIAVPPREP